MGSVLANGKVIRVRTNECGHGTIGNEIATFTDDSYIKNGRLVAGRQGPYTRVDPEQGGRYEVGDNSTSYRNTEVIPPVNGYLEVEFIWGGTDFLYGCFNGTDNCVVGVRAGKVAAGIGTLTASIVKGTTTLVLGTVYVVRLEWNTNDITLTLNGAIEYATPRGTHNPPTDVTIYIHAYQNAGNPAFEAVGGSGIAKVNRVSIADSTKIIHEYVAANMLYDIVGTSNAAAVGSALTTGVSPYGEKSMDIRGYSIDTNTGEILPAMRSGRISVDGNLLEHAGTNAISAELQAYAVSGFHESMDVSGYHGSTVRITIGVVLANTGGYQIFIDGRGATSSDDRSFYITSSGAYAGVNVTTTLDDVALPMGNAVVFDDAAHELIITYSVPTTLNALYFCRHFSSAVSIPANIIRYRVEIDDVIVRDFVVNELSVVNNAPTPNDVAVSTTGYTINNIPAAAEYIYGTDVSLVQTPIFTDGTTEYVTTVNTSGTFDINSKNIVGTIPPELGNLTNIDILSLALNQLTGSIPPELGNLTNLRNIYFYNNQLTGSIPPELGNLSDLRFLYLNDNQLSGTIPPELGNLTNLQYLYLYRNQLTGTLPSELGSLSNIVELKLYTNQLTGSIPPELGNLSGLKYLHLYDNQLSGPIPPELGNLTNLLNLRLYTNQLSGTIPPELGNLSNLDLLYIHENQLSGSIPPELGNLTNVQYLSLYTNQLTGTIPPELGNLTNLLYLYLNDNQLTSADDFLIAAANNASTTAWVNTTISLSGNGLTLSTAAQNAVTTLENNGCTVTI